MIISIFLPLFMRVYGGILHAICFKDFRENVNQKITYDIENEQFKSRSKVGLPGVSSRDRKLTFTRLLVSIMIFKSSIQRGLDRFFKQLRQSDYSIREVSKSAFSQSRANLLGQEYCPSFGFQRTKQLQADGQYYTLFASDTPVAEGKIEATCRSASNRQTQKRA